MKKLSNVLFVIILFVPFTFSQSVSVSKITELTNLNSGEFYYPKFSSDNSRIFFTQSNYKGLYYLNTKDNSITKITDDDGAGYEFVIDPNNNSVYYRSDKYINRRKYSSIKACDIQTLKVRTIESDKRDVSTPKLIDNGNVFYTVQRNMKSFENKTLKQKSRKLTSTAAFVQIENTKIVLYQGSKKKILAPLGNGNYIWPSLSPDNTKILFTFAGKGTFITDLNGKILVNLGYANYPRWSPDGKWIAYMVDKDDGMNVIYSDIFVSSADGKNKFQLTDSKDVNEMYPEWSSSGNEIVVNSYDGKILLMKLNIEE
ncbi:MAG: hypothetical protein M1480_08715 [Bacteroidetes bacterium]|nr:hypothetical protein [Bacteroidota bacterium]